MLHDRTSGRILKALGRYPHIDVTSAPYFFAKRARKPQDASVVPAGRDVK
jgi:hypothetical protein